jgi:hypothetical protein
MIGDRFGFRPQDAPSQPTEWTEREEGQGPTDGAVRLR